MLRFVVRRLLLLVPILLGLSILVFFWIRALPGGPAQALLGERATPETVAQIERAVRPRRADLRPVLARTSKTIVEGDLGTSITTRRPVVDELKQRFPATIELAFAAMIFAIVVRRPARLHRREDATGRRSTTRAWSCPCSASRSRSSSSRSCSSTSSRCKLGLVTHGRAASRPDRPRAPDELLHPRRDHRRRPGGALGLHQAPDPARDRARLDPARDHRAHHARGRARRPERGLRAHGARQGPGAARRRPTPHLPQRAAADRRRSSGCRPGCCSRARC